MLHYNFPPFSVGEVGRMTGVGEEKLVMEILRKSLKIMFPAEDHFPYTVRIISIFLNRMVRPLWQQFALALALMDAGVPMKKPVAGIAMGFIKEGEKFAMFSDILGNEDHLGDMDFKVQEQKGITAFQMDIKIQGISLEIMEKAL